MPTTMFRYIGEEAPLKLREYFVSAEGEMPRADAGLKAAPEAELTLEKSIDYPIAVTRFSSRGVSELSWRRTAERIRADGGDFFLFRFVERGRVQAITSHGVLALEAGQFSISRGDQPYVSQSYPDLEGIHEAYQVWAPARLIGHHLTSDSMARSFSCASPAGAVARVLLHALFAHGQGLDSATRTSVAEAWLTAVVTCLRGGEPAPRRGSIAEERLGVVLQHIREHATRPDLKVAAVAQSCGISRRYLSLLLARRGLSFADLVREARLGAAETMLVTASRPIGEIAALAGFRSASQFSRAFRRFRGLAPREFRARGRSGAIHPRWEQLLAAETGQPDVLRKHAAGSPAGAGLES
jgi:AraC-like DNA-binding protein